MKRKDIYMWLLDKEKMLSKGQDIGTLFKYNFSKDYEKFSRDHGGHKGKINTEKLYLWIFPKAKNKAKCCLCKSTEVKFQNLEKGYREFCSKQCSSKVIGLKLQKIIQEKYGVSNISKLPWVKKKKEKTTLMNFGVRNPLCKGKLRNKWTKEYQKIYGYSPYGTKKSRDKAKITSRVRYGVDHYMQLEDSSKKLFKAYKVKTGYNHPQNNPEVRKKVEKTNLKRYGHKCNLQSEEIKRKIQRIHLEKYGVTNPTKNPYILQKALRNSFLTHEIKIKNCTFLVQGRNEASLLKYLITQYTISGVLTQFDKKFPLEKCKELGTTPDFYLPKKEIFIECKSLWTLCKNSKTLKINQFKAKSGKDCVRWVVAIKNKFVLLPIAWYKWQFKKLSIYLNISKDYMLN